MRSTIAIQPKVLTASGTDRKIEEIKGYLAKAGITEAVLSAANRKGKTTPEFIRQIALENVENRKKLTANGTMEKTGNHLPVNSADIDAILEEWFADKARIETLLSEIDALQIENARLKACIQTIDKKTLAKSAFQNA